MMESDHQYDNHNNHNNHIHMEERHDHSEYNDDPLMHDDPDVNHEMHGLMHHDHDIPDTLGPEDEEELRNIDSSYNNGYSLKQWNSHGEHPIEDDNGMMRMDSFHDHNEAQNEAQYSNQHSPDYAQHSPSQENYNFFDDSNMNLSMGDVGRMNRMAQAEVAIRQEMFKDCTFRPHIKALPNSYGAMKDNGTSFLQRSNKWTKEKEAEMKKKLDAVQRNELADCTFTPKLSKNSERTVREMRGNAREDFAERLYKSSNLLTEQRFKLIEHERAKEEYNESVQCTFQPQLITKKFNDGVTSKVFREKKDPKSQSLPNQDSSKGDDFTPKINKIKPHMQSAKAYCSVNVMERLTRPVSAAPVARNAQASDRRGSNQSGNESDSGRIMDVNSFMSKNDVPQTVFTSPVFSINTYNRAEVDANQKGDEKDKHLTAEELKARKLKFEQFLKRQQKIMKTKDLSVKLLQTAYTPSFEPTLCKKSIEMVDKRFKNTDFINRLERDLQKRTANEEGLSRSAHDALKEETFKPKINSKSEKLQGRSPFEMSRGDMFRKDTTARLTKLQQEQEEMEITTFKPKYYTSKSQQKPSKLGLAQDPTQFLERYKENLAEHKNLCEQEKKRREDEEFAECSFTPKTVDCPEYVRRIAKSMAIVKAAKSSQLPVDNKPDWR